MNLGKPKTWGNTVQPCSPSFSPCLWMRNPCSPGHAASPRSTAEGAWCRQRVAAAGETLR